jgi:hypothetical protein
MESAEQEQNKAGKTSLHSESILTAPSLRNELVGVNNFVAENLASYPCPSCHVCGGMMVPNEFKCLSCKATTGVVSSAADSVAAAPAPPSREWIPVSERLPEEGQEVLAWFDDDNSSVGGERRQSAQVWEYSEGHPYFPKRNGKRQGVTYWQALPAPPVADSGASAREEKQPKISLDIWH